MAHIYFGKKRMENKQRHWFLRVNEQLSDTKLKSYLWSKTFDIDTGGPRLRRADYFTDRIGEALFASDSALLSSVQARNLLEIGGNSRLNNFQQRHSYFPSLINSEKIQKDNITIFLSKNTVDTLTYYIPHIGRSIQYLDDFTGLNKRALCQQMKQFLRDIKILCRIRRITSPNTLKPKIN